MTESFPIRHWNELSDNPEDPSVVRWRQSILISTRSKNSDFIHDYVRNACSGKAVLDFGYANHSSATIHLGGASVHQSARSESKSIIGIDLVAPQDIPGQRPGDQYFSLDVLGRDLPQDLRSAANRVEVVLASNVLEHLSDIGAFFTTFAELCPGATIHVLAPNPLWFLGLRDLWINAPESSSLTVDHTCLLYPSSLVEIGDRFGYKCCSWRYLGRGDMPKFIGFLSRKRFLFHLAMGASYAMSRAMRWPTSFNQIAVEFVPLSASDMHH